MDTVLMRKPYQCWVEEYGNTLNAAQYTVVCLSMKACWCLLVIKYAKGHFWRASLQPVTPQHTLGSSSLDIEVYTSLCWTSWVSCQPISPVCSSGYQHEPHLYQLLILVLYHQPTCRMWQPVSPTNSCPITQVTNEDGEQDCIQSGILTYITN